MSGQLQIPATGGAMPGADAKVIEATVRVAWSATKPRGYHASIGFRFSDGSANSRTVIGNWPTVAAAMDAALTVIETTGKARQSNIDDIDRARQLRKEKSMRRKDGTKLNFSGEGQAVA